MDADRRPEGGRGQTHPLAKTAKAAKKSMTNRVLNLGELGALARKPLPFNREIREFDPNNQSSFIPNPCRGPQIPGREAKSSIINHP
jgi:hypothetical protein